MADVMGSMNAVYAKWENKNTVNGVGPPLRSHSASNVLENGKKAWKTKFKEVPPQPDRRRSARTSSNKAKSVAQLPLSAIVGAFKSTPSIKPPYNHYMRPVTGRCCKCMPISRDSFMHVSLAEMPDITNVLRLPELSCRHSAILSMFSNVAYTYRHTVRFGYPNITESVLRSHRSQLAVEKTVQEMLDQRGLPLDENSKEYKKEKKKCDGKLKKLFQIMNAVMSIPLFKLTGWFLNTVLSALLCSVQVHNAQLLTLKDASLSGKPVIYLPMHRSHLDYVLLTYILWHYGIRAPYVAAGDNLNIFGFGRILRSLGGFFIRRRLDKEAGKKDHLYRAVLSEYVEELLKRGQSLEFFVEGGRSRSGKAYYPKAGLLSIVVDWVLASRNETDGILRLDALIVPVGISYEKIVDGNFTREQMGMPKKPESFWATVKAIWKLFSTTFGNVRVDFCQPFSLKEYLSVNHQALALSSTSRDSPVTVPGCPGLRDSMQDLQNINQPDEALPRSVSGNSIYGIDISKVEEKAVIDALARHVVYNSMCASAVMSTNILAFDLLTNYRQGVSLTELINSIDKLRDVILCANRDLGFVGQSSDVIAHGCKLLGPNLVSIEINDNISNWQELYNTDSREQIRITPNLSLPHALELSYYSAPVISAFQLKSLITCSISAAAGAALLDGSAEESYSSVSFTKESVVAHALYLADVLKYEFLFTAPCKDLETELGDVFESLISSELIVSPDQEDTYNEEAQQWTSRIVRKAMYGFHEDDTDDFYAPDKEYKLNLGEREQLRWCSTLLQPTIECYWVVACKLFTLLVNDQPLAEFTKQIHSDLISRVSQGITNYPECVAQDMVKNALHSLCDMKVTQCYDIASERMISVTDAYNSEHSLNEVVTRMDSYRPL